MDKKILLIYPSINPDNPHPDILENVDLDPGGKVVPLGLLSVSGVLEQNGFKVEIIDCRFYTKSYIYKMIDEKINGCILVGFSLMTVQIKHALLLSKYIKEKYNVKIVMGGIHPTLFPQQTCEDDRVDFIISGEGEYPLLNLLNNLTQGAPPLESIPGLGYKKNGEFRINLPPPLIDVEKLPPFPYHLLDIEKYIKRKLLNGKIVRGIDVLTSRGCPYRCAFCVNPHLNYRKWRAISSEVVLNLISFLVDKYRLNNIWFSDDYLFGEKKRITEIAKGIIERRMNITWSGNIRADNFRPGGIDDEALDLIKQSGCYALYIGMESGVDRILKIYKKDITIAQIINAVKQCKKHGILPKGFWMMGAPGEEISDIKKTLSLIWKLHKIDNNFSLSAPGIYRPYPGGELYEEAKRLGFKEPKSLQEWGSSDLYAGYLDSKSLPWLKKPGILQDFRFYGLLLIADSIGFFNTRFRCIFKILVKLSKLRYKYGFWDFRIEALIYKLTRHILLRFFPKWRFVHYLK
jgi:radical SAM superfamily enzyme YgiQ (UPF0313 family)